MLDSDTRVFLLYANLLAVNGRLHQALTMAEAALDLRLLRAGLVAEEALREKYGTIWTG